MHVYVNISCANMFFITTCEFTLEAKKTDYFPSETANGIETIRNEYFKGMLHKL